MPPAPDCLACQPGLDRLLTSDPGAAECWRTLPRRQLSAGSVLLRQGERTDRVWQIERGLVRCYFLSADGRERNRSFHAEGSWVGSGVPPLATVSTYTIEALEPLSLVELAYDTLHRWLELLPRLQSVLNDGVSTNFDLQTRREADLLLLDAAGRYQAFLNDHADVAGRIPLHHVASYLGITPVALSRIRSRLGLVAVRSAPRGA